MRGGVILPPNVIDTPKLREQLGAFRGRWVAIRTGSIIADASTLGELIRDERVERTDTRMKVPGPDHGAAA